MLDKIKNNYPLILAIFVAFVFLQSLFLRALNYLANLRILLFIFSKRWVHGLEILVFPVLVRCSDSTEELQSVWLS